MKKNLGTIVLMLVLFAISCGGKKLSKQEIAERKQRVQELQKERQIKIDTRQDTLHYEAFNDVWLVVSAKSQDHNICKYLLVHSQDTTRKKGLFANCSFLSVGMEVRTCLTRKSTARARSRVIWRDSLLWEDKQSQEDSSPD